jgi:predicted MPP superfamily phosphohydrolase
MISLIITAFGIVFLDIITVWGLKRSFPQYFSRHRRGIWVAFIMQTTVSVVAVLYGLVHQRQISDYHLFAWYYFLWGLMVALYLPKSFYAFLLIADWILSKISKLHRRQFDKFPRGSRCIIARCGFWASVAFMCVLVWSILFGRNIFKVEHVEIFVDNLPNAFHGYKIVQISDIHAGSFSRSAKHFEKAVDLINQQEPNLIVFTGDMVNNFADEAIPLIPVFSQLEAHDGKYAVLGNHDYGGYSKWDDPADSVANHAALVHAIEQMGFVLLNNKSVIINRYNSNRMGLIGVESWGVNKRHPREANLEKAIKPVRYIPFKVLLSHDPIFWHVEVEGKTDIALTLSGHTHGMQMGLKLLKKYYSLAPLLGLPYGAGLYKTDKQYLYVNRGLGVVGFPGRIGMSSDISVITLWKTKLPEQP